MTGPLILQRNSSKSTVFHGAIDLKCSNSARPMLAVKLSLGVSSSRGRGDDRPPFPNTLNILQNRYHAFANLLP